jgi:hypothetical protein
MKQDFLGGCEGEGDHIQPLECMQSCMAGWPDFHGERLLGVQHPEWERYELGAMTITTPVHAYSDSNKIDPTEVT